MDVLAGLLQGNRASGAFILRIVFEPPWALLIRDEAPLTVVTMLEGSAWAIRPGLEPALIGPGEVAVVKGDEAYVLADRPDTTPMVVVEPGQVCRSLDGSDVSESMMLGVRTWGNDLSGSCTMLTGIYQLDTEVSRRLLRALPPVFSVPVSNDTKPILDLLTAEAGREVPGQEAVLDRLLDLLLMTVLRDWLSRRGPDAPGWFVAHGDPIVGPALRMMFNDPARPWTVAALAAEIGVSRAALAKRFTDLVGDSPMAFLTEWRLTLAADLLRHDNVTIAAVAGQVGYATPYGLSTAFKRQFGVSPSEYRKSSTAA
jgi:AraC-like DNA-binding protein